LKSEIALVCFYSIYWFLIRNENRFNVNRFIILFSLLLSSLIPIISFEYVFPETNQVVQSFQLFIISGIDESSIYIPETDTYSIYSIVYIIGLMVLSIRSLIGVATLIYLYVRFPKKSYYGFKAVIINGNRSPFTFFNILFINSSDFHKEKIDELIIHEQAHKDQFHSLDLILLEIMTIIHWFNPIMWLFKYDLKSEHEFIADERVIKLGYDKTRYQYLLLKANTGIALFLVNNFNYSILKKRLKMMTSQKSNRTVNLKYFLAMPLLIISATVLFFSFQLSEQISSDPDTLPVYKAGEKEFYKSIQRSLKYPLEARKNNIQGTVYLSFTVNKEGEIENIKADKSKHILLKKIVVVAYSNDAPAAKDKINHNLSPLEMEAERVMGELGEFIPGKTDGNAVSTRLTLPIDFLLGMR